MRKSWSCSYATLTVFLLGASSQVSAYSVAVYGDGENASGFADRVHSLGYVTTLWTDPNELTPQALSQIDVLFVHTGYARDLSWQASSIAAWMFEGHGLIVEQPNRVGSVDILPPGLDISIWSIGYDGSRTGPDPIRDVRITELGARHPIMAGLTTGDLPENADRVLVSDISPSYSILGVQITNPVYVAVASARYGDGRVVFETGNTGPGSMDPGSDQYVGQMIDWAAVPEPMSLLLLGLGGLILVRRRCTPPTPAETPRVRVDG